MVFITVQCGGGPASVTLNRPTSFKGNVVCTALPTWTG